MALRSPHEIHEADVNAIKELIAGSGPDDAAERERLLWQLVGIHAGALTPVSENEKRGMGARAGDPRAQARGRRWFD
jgi:hypothetical protein